MKHSDGLHGNSYHPFYDSVDAPLCNYIIRYPILSLLYFFYFIFVVFEIMLNCFRRFLFNSVSSADFTIMLVVHYFVDGNEDGWK